MKDEEFLRRIGVLYEQFMSMERNEDYEINPPQMEKFMRLLEYFSKEVARQGDSMDKIKLVPKERRGDVTAYFYDFTVDGNESVQRFADAVSGCSVFGFDTLTDGRICIECTVPDVFVRKKS